MGGRADTGWENKVIVIGGERVIIKGSADRGVEDKVTVAGGLDVRSRESNELKICWEV